MKDKEIYFHIGMGKAASTFLQDKFFPKLKDITYLHRSKYHKYKKNIDNCRSSKILISREFDNQLKKEVSRFLSDFPYAKIIVVFREQKGWIASQYKRQVKNGFDGSLTDFINVENDSGHWKCYQANYQPIIDFIEDCSKQKPLILNYAELINDPKSFFDKLVNYMDCNYDFYSINLQRKHTAYSEKQLIIKRKVNPFLFNRDWETSRIKSIRWIRRRTEMLLTYFVFLVANIIPNRLIKDEKLLSSNDLDRIEEHYREDWNKIISKFN